MLDLLMGEYHMTFQAAMWKFPAAAALALLPAFRRRRGFEESGSSYADRAARKARRRMARRIREKYTVLD